MGMRTSESKRSGALPEVVSYDLGPSVTPAVVNDHVGVISNATCMRENMAKNELSGSTKRDGSKSTTG